MFNFVVKRSFVKMTQECAQQIKKICSNDQFLRLTVEGGAGCGGFTYKFEISNTLNTNDHIIEENGSKLVIDNDSFSIVEGAKIDYTQEMIRRAFSVKENPNAEMTCGCGTSFNPKPFPSKNK